MPLKWENHNQEEKKKNPRNSEIYCILGWRGNNFMFNLLEFFLLLKGKEDLIL